MSPKAVPDPPDVPRSAEFWSKLLKFMDACWRPVEIQGEVLVLVATLFGDDAADELEPRLKRD